jgi:hypothetical protein
MTFVQSNTTQVHVINSYYLHMYATCFGLYVGHLQACQHKNMHRKILYKSKGPVLTFTVFVVLNYHANYVK